MRDEAKICLAAFVCAAVIVIVVGLVAVAVKSAQCHASWGRSGLKAEWGLMQGCLVGLPDGRWLPAERLREMDIQSKGAKQ